MSAAATGTASTSTHTTPSRSRSPVGDRKHGGLVRRRSRSRSRSRSPIIKKQTWPVKPHEHGMYLALSLYLVPFLLRSLANVDIERLATIIRYSYGSVEMACQFCNDTRGLDIQGWNVGRDDRNDMGVVFCCKSSSCTQLRHLAVALEAASDHYVSFDDKCTFKDINFRLDADQKVIDEFKRKHGVAVDGHATFIKWSEKKEALIVGFRYAPFRRIMYTLSELYEMNPSLSMPSIDDFKFNFGHHYPAQAQESIQLKLKDAIARATVDRNKSLAKEIAAVEKVANSMYGRLCSLVSTLASPIPHFPGGLSL